MRRILILAFLFFFACPAWGKNLESSILRVYTHVQKPDYDAPWAGKSSERLTHMGVLIDAQHVLTAAFAATGARHFEVEMLGDSRPYAMELEFSDPAVDLALLRFSGDRPRGLVPLSLGPDIKIEEAVTLYQALEGETLVASALRLREVEARPIFLTSYPAPQYVFELKRSGYGWFEPLIKDGKMIGAAIAQAGSLVYALPASIIKRFLRESRAKPYKGFAELGFSLSPFTSPDLRRWAKAGKIDSQRGAWVHAIDPDGSFAHSLRESDILLEFNGSAVSSRGSYVHPLWGRLSLQAKPSELGMGDRIQLKILRDGKVKQIEGKAQRSEPSDDKLVPALGEEPNYLIFGGLLFQELSRGLIESWGSQWRKRAPLFYLMEEAFGRYGRAKDRRVVLQRVFPLEYNKGYHDLENDFVVKVNGREVSHLDSVRKALSDPEALKGTYAHIQLEPGGDEIILNYEGIDQVHSVLQQRYAIPTSANFWKAPEPESAKSSL